MISLSDFLNNSIESSVKLLFAGDSMNNSSQRDLAYVDDHWYDYRGYFDRISNVVHAADYAVVNLETPIHYMHYKQKRPDVPLFGSHTNYLAEIKKAGFDMCTTANNHALDQGESGVISTLQELDGYGLDHIGTYANVVDRQLKRVFIRNVGGIKIGFLNYTYKTPDTKPEDHKQYSVVINYLNPGEIKKDITTTRRAGAEFIICLLHWREELESFPTPDQKKLAHDLLDAGADAIIGTHPHVVQPLELENNKLIAYSLGNFVSGMLRNKGGARDIHGGLILSLELERKNGIKIKKAEYRLTWTHTVRDNVRVDWLDVVDWDKEPDAKKFKEEVTKLLSNNKKCKGGLKSFLFYLY